MSAAMARPRGPQLTQTPEYLRAEFGHGSASDIGELYQAVAVTCIQHQVLRVLIIAGDDDASGEGALRAAVTRIVLAGISAGFRLALVVSSPRMAYAYRNTGRDLNAAEIRTRLFDNEDEALRWLDVADKVRRRAA